MQSIALADTLTISARPGPFALMSRTPGVPEDRTNLVWRAAETCCGGRLGRAGDPRDAHIRLEKQIPVAAGLGRRQRRRGRGARGAERGVGRPAAAAGLAGGWRRPSGPTCRSSSRGHGARDGPRGRAVPGRRRRTAWRGDVIKPSFGVATADAYRWLDEDRAPAEASDPAGAPAGSGSTWAGRPGR